MAIQILARHAPDAPDARVLVERLCMAILLEGRAVFPPLDPSVRRRLRDLLRPEVEMLENLIHRDLSKWKTAISQSAERTSPEIIRPE